MALAYAHLQSGNEDISVSPPTEWDDSLARSCPCEQEPVDDAHLYDAVRNCSCKSPAAADLFRRAVEYFARTDFKILGSDGALYEPSDEQRRAFIFIATLPDLEATDPSVVDGVTDAAGVDRRRVVLLTGRM